MSANQKNPNDSGGGLQSSPQKSDMDLLAFNNNQSSNKISLLTMEDELILLGNMFNTTEKLGAIKKLLEVLRQRKNDPQLYRLKEFFVQILAAHNDFPLIPKEMVLEMINTVFEITSHFPSPTSIQTLKIFLGILRSHRKNPINAAFLQCFPYSAKSMNLLNIRLALKDQQLKSMAVDYILFFLNNFSDSSIFHFTDNIEVIEYLNWEDKRRKIDSLGFSVRGKGEKAEKGEKAPTLSYEQIEQNVNNSSSMKKVMGENQAMSNRLGAIEEWIKKQETEKNSQEPLAKEAQMKELANKVGKIEEQVEIMMTKFKKMERNEQIGSRKQSIESMNDIRQSMDNIISGREIANSSKTKELEQKMQEIEKKVWSKIEKIESFMDQVKRPNSQENKEMRRIIDDLNSSKGNSMLEDVTKMLQETQKALNEKTASLQLACDGFGDSLSDFRQRVHEALSKINSNFARQASFNEKVEDYVNSIM